MMKLMSNDEVDKLKLHNHEVDINICLEYFMAPAKTLPPQLVYT